MMRTRHSIAALALAIISTASLARPPLYTWFDASHLELPAQTIEFAKGKKHTLAQFKGNVVLLNLWATWCGPCLEELPTLDALEKKRAKEGLVVVTLSIDQSKHFSELRDWANQEELTLNHLAYNKSGAFSKMALQGLPVTYLIDRRGKLRYQYHGATDWTASGPQDKIDELLSEK